MGVERRENIGESCSLFDECLKMSTGHPLLAQEVSQVKRDVADIKKSEEHAKEKRHETHEMVVDVKNKLEGHVKAFSEQNKAITELSKSVNCLTETVGDMHSDSLSEKQDQKWMKIIGYGIILIIIWLLVHVNETDKLLTETSTNLKSNTKVIEKLDNYLRKGVDNE